MTRPVMGALVLILALLASSGALGLGRTVAARAAGEPAPAAGSPAPDIERRLRTLGEEFRRASSDRRYEIAREAMSLGDAGIRLVGQFMRDGHFQRTFPTPDARYVFRARIAVELARTNSPAAVEVLQGYYYQGKRRGRIDRSTPYEIKFDWQKPIATATDETGARWALIHLWWYGGYWDLWLIRSTDGERWSYPLFTGYGGLSGGGEAMGMEPSLAVVRGVATIRYPTVGRQADGRGTHAMRQVEVRLSDLKRDSDGDGLYDVEERRFGTDPKRPDTDRDGLVDGEDLNPLVAGPPRFGTDEEAIRQAVFRQRERARVRVCFVQARPAERQEYLGESGGIVLSRSKEEIREDAIEGPLFVFERIQIDRAGGRAEVDFVDREGPYAAQSHSLALRKMNGVWVVTEDKLTGVS